MQVEQTKPNQAKRRRSRDESWSWPRTTSFVLAAIPVAVLVFIVVALVKESVPALRDVGLRNLFSTHFSGVYSGGQRSYGLLPAMWGTLMVVILSMSLALPVSLAMAVFCSYMPFGVLGKAMNAILNVFSGIPPIVYALMSFVFVDMFIIPKFAAKGMAAHEVGALPGLTWWNPGMLPTEGSTLLGALLLALLVIPFMAPLINDAIRGVPSGMQEASYALGATRWYTLRRIVLPGALTGIVAAASLGALKALGDVIIVGWAIGFESGLPDPLFDVFEKTAPLTSTAAGLMGGFAEGGNITTQVIAPGAVPTPTPLPPVGATPVPLTGSVTAPVIEMVDAAPMAYFSGLVLLVLAFAILGAAMYMQRRLQRGTSE